MTHKFEITVEISAVLELDEKVIAQVDDDFRKSLYDLKTEGDIAEHIGYNLVVNGSRLTQLDGWADLFDDMAKVTNRVVETWARKLTP